MINRMLTGACVLTTRLGICQNRAIAQAPPPLPPALSVSDGWSQYRQKLLSEDSALRAQIIAHNSMCTGVPPSDTGRVAQCQQSRAALLAASDTYQTHLAAYRDAVANPFAPPAASRARTITRNGKTYQVSGHGMIGGTIWITGYNVQSADPALIERARAMMVTQMRLAGQDYADAVDFGHYNFVLGIAAANDSAGTVLGPLLDLGSRVLPDEYSNGGFSADNQALYASLKGRAFGDLACHSNGAMVCLAALSRGDILADHVTLFGPQITVDALKAWDRLVRDGKVKSVQLIYNSGDPVAPVSLAIGGGIIPGGSAVMALALFKPAVLGDVVSAVAPSISTRIFTCSQGVALDCHSMDVYRRNLAAAGCKSVASGLRVAGTALPGRPETEVLEPPAPC